MIDISIVIPLYNEEANFDPLVSRLEKISQELSQFTFEVILVDDGSEDQTPNLMSALALNNKRYYCVFLSRNYGHQLALSAGLKCARASKAIMVLDGDLQDPPEMIHQFLKAINQGFEVVYGVRKRRKESPLKRIAYWTYYRLVNRISKVDLPLDSGDFCMISRKALNYLISMPEQNRYLRGMRSWIGFKQLGIQYERSSRHAGTTKYSWSQLFDLAYSGIYNFSRLPIKFITILGVLTIGVSFIYVIYVLIAKYFFGNVPTGFTALIIALVMFSGVQLISLGVIGEYVIRIYQQSQNRPLFIIDKVIVDAELKDGQELLS